MSDGNGSIMLVGALGAAWLAGVAGAAAQTPTPVPVSAASSAAYGVAATFTGGGMSTALGPVAPVSGSAPPAYSRSEVVPSYSGSVAIPPLVPSAVVFPMVANLSVDAAMLVSHVASPGFGVDDISATGTSSLDAVALHVANPEPPPSPVSPDFLSVIASGVQASANFSKVVPIAPVVTGTASFGSLTIAGSLLGGQTVTYAGTAPANTVLYRSATITITADQQVRAVLVACPPCTVTPAQIVVHALDIAFRDAVIDGRSFSGEIVVGDASAGQ